MILLVAALPIVAHMPAVALTALMLYISCVSTALVYLPNVLATVSRYNDTDLPATWSATMNYFGSAKKVLLPAIAATYVSVTAVSALCWFVGSLHSGDTPQISASCALLPTLASIPLLSIAGRCMGRHIVNDGHRQHMAEFFLKLDIHVARRPWTKLYRAMKFFVHRMALTRAEKAGLVGIFILTVWVSLWNVSQAEASIGAVYSPPIVQVLIAYSSVMVVIYMISETLIAAVAESKEVVTVYFDEE